MVKDLRSPPRVRVIGIGNPLRGDDGAGWCAARQIEALRLREVDVVLAQQLQAEMLEDFRHCAEIVLIDAARGGPAVRAWRVFPAVQTPGTAHAMSPAALLALSWRFCRRAPRMRVVQIRGEHFGFSTLLSEAAAARCRRAVALIRAQLRARA